ncbi:sensor histidine kinase [Streptomyces sp. NPDC054961]
MDPPRPATNEVERGHPRRAGTRRNRCVPDTRTFVRNAPVHLRPHAVVTPCPARSAGVGDGPPRGPPGGGRHLTVVRELTPPTVRGDRTLLGHPVRNLPAHAVRHSRTGGRLEVETSSDGVLTVCNTGPVIAPQDVPGLLEPFRRRAERQHTAGEGAGLGLSTVASIARAHGAEPTARADPGPGGGLTVRVRFPAASTVEETPGRLTGQPNRRSAVYGRDNEQARPSRLPSVPSVPFVLPGERPVP